MYCIPCQKHDKRSFNRDTWNSIPCKRLRKERLIRYEECQAHRDSVKLEPIPSKTNASSAISPTLPEKGMQQAFCCLYFLATIDLSTANESANVNAKNAATTGLSENGESDRGNGQGRGGRRRRWWKSRRGGRQTHQQSASTTSTTTQSTSTNGGGWVRGNGKTYRRGRGRS